MGYRSFIDGSCVVQVQIVEHGGSEEQECQEEEHRNNKGAEENPLVYGVVHGMHVL